MGGFPILYKLCVVLDRRLYPLRLYSDIALCDGSGAML